MVQYLDNESANNWPYGAPIIICGRSRSGTTFVRNLLNAHSEIYIGRELREDFYQNALQLFDLTQNIFTREKFRGTMPQYAQARLLRSLFYYAEPQADSARRMGNKTPGNEWRLATFERVFSVQPPTYIYVLRRGIDQITSVRNQTWGRQRTVATLVHDYCKSLEQFEKMRERFPERVHLVQPDLATDIDKRAALVQNLFAAIGEAADSYVEGFSRTWEKANATNPQLQNPLTAPELEILDKHTEFSLSQQRYGYQ